MKLFGKKIDIGEGLAVALWILCGIGWVWFCGWSGKILSETLWNLLTVKVDSEWDKYEIDPIDGLTKR